MPASAGAAAKEAGFSISSATIEAEGLCSTCVGATAARAQCKLTE